MADGANALVLDLNADTAKALKNLDKLTKRLEGLAPELEGKGKKAMAGLERSFTGEGVGKALDKVFDRSRLAVIEEGSAKIPIFGAAIEALGPAGIAAAAGLVTVGIAAEQARKAMEWADELDRTAKKLGTTTTSLQEFDYAAVATSIGLQQGREAMAQFNVAIGKFETHTGDVKLAKWADTVKLTRSEVNKTVDPVEKLSLVMEKIAKLSDAQSRSAAAKSFGLEELLPIINEGSEGIEKFLGKMREARENGSIIDPREIAKAAELNDKVEELSYRIGIDLKRSFIDLAPAIEGVVAFIERCTHALADFIGTLPAALRGIEALANFHLPTIPGAEDRVARVQAATDSFGAAHLVASAYRALVARGQAAQLGDKIGAMLAGGKVNLTGSDFDPALARQGRGAQLNFDKPKGGKSDQTSEFDKVATDAYQSGLKALIEAQKALTGDIEKRAEFEKAAIDADLTKKLADLDAQEAKIRASKNDSHRAEQLALIDKAKTEEQNAAAAKKELVDRNTEIALNKQILENTLALNGYMDRQLAAQLSIANTAQKRADLELELLKSRQYQERLSAKDDLAAKVKSGIITSGEAQDRLSELGKAQADELAAGRVKAELDTHPIEAYLDKLKDVDTQIANEGVTALDGLAGGIAEIVANGGKAGDVLRGLIRHLLYDNTKALVQQGEAGILRKFGVKAPDAIKAAETGHAIAAPIVEAGEVAGTSIATQFEAAGAAVAGQIAAAMASGALTGGSSGGGGFLKSLLGGAGGLFKGGFGGDFGTFSTSRLSGFSTGFTGLPGFATGGSFKVGGMGGVDQNLVQFKASRGELVSVETPEQQRANRTGGGATFHMSFPGITNARDARTASKVAAAEVGRAWAMAAKAGVGG